MALAGLCGADLLKFGLHLLHGHLEIAIRTGPAGGMDARRPAEGIDHEAAVVGKRRKLGGVGRRHSLQAGVSLKGGLGLLRLGQTELAGGDGLHPVRLQQHLHLDELAGIVGGHHQPAGELARHQPIASFWRETS